MYKAGSLSLGTVHVLSRNLFLWLFAVLQFITQSFLHVLQRLGLFSLPYNFSWGAIRTLRDKMSAA